MPKDKKLHANGGWRGPGKVHLYIYSSLNKLWYVACRSDYGDYYGEIVDPKTPVTCKKCIAQGAK